MKCDILKNFYLGHNFLECDSNASQVAKQDMLFLLCAPQIFPRIKSLCDSKNILQGKSRAIQNRKTSIVRRIHNFFAASTFCTFLGEGPKVKSRGNFHLFSSKKGVEIDKKALFHWERGLLVLKTFQLFPSRHSSHKVIMYNEIKLKMLKKPFSEI